MDKSLYLVVKNDIEEVMKKVFSAYDAQAKLLEYFDYLPCNNGKLTRAVMLYLVYDLVENKKNDNLKYLATSLELLHTASLIHDDIMDCSTMRRGKKCIHEEYGMNAALLTTDFLIFNSVKLISDTMKELPCSKNIVSIIMGTFCDLCVGQSLEERLISNLNVNENDYYEVIRLKTAVFFSMICEVSTVLADSNKKTINKFKQLGLNIGMAFQIRDDLMDYCLDENMNNKSKDIDAKKRLVTLPIILAYKRGNLKQKSILMTYYDSKQPIEIEQVYEVVYQTGAFEETINVIDGYLNSCLDILTEINSKGNTEILKNMIDNLRVSRELAERVI